MKLSQFPDCQTYGKLLTKINALNPTEVLMSSNDLIKKEIFLILFLI